MFTFGIRFGLRANKEHKDLVYGGNSQITLIKENGIEKLRYKEHVSKSRNFGLKQAKMEPKIVIAEPNTEHPYRCIVHLYKKFISHRPPNITSFYLTPLKAAKSSVWYKSSPLGIHQIEKMTAKLLKDVDGNFSNTSLRRTTKTRLVQAGVPTAVSKSLVGHLSNADEVYVCQSAFKEKVSNALTGSKSNSDIVRIETHQSTNAINANGPPEKIMKIVADGAANTVTFTFE